MVKTTIEAVFNEPIETIWHIVTDLTNADWRSDLSRIEVLEDKKEFIESRLSHKICNNCI